MPTTDQPTSDHIPVDLPKSRATINFHVDADVDVQVGDLTDGAVTLEIGAAMSPARLVIFARGRQALWGLLVEAERQLAHLATEPAVDPAVVADAGQAVDEFDQTTWPACEHCGRQQVHRSGCPVIAGDGGAS